MTTKNRKRLVKIVKALIGLIVTGTAYLIYLYASDGRVKSFIDLYFFGD